MLDGRGEDAGGVGGGVFAVYFEGFREGIGHVVGLAEFGLHYIGGFFEGLACVVVCSMVNIKCLRRGGGQSWDALCFCTRNALAA